MRTEKLLTASDVIEVLGITDNILRSWDKSGILKPVNDEGKRFFRGVDIEKIKIGQVPAKQEKQGIESILNSTAMKTMLFINSISTLNEKSKKLAMQGNLKDSIKYRMNALLFFLRLFLLYASNTVNINSFIESLT